MRRCPLERKSQSIFDHCYRRQLPAQLGEVNLLVAVLSKMFYMRQFAYANEKQLTTAGLIHAKFYSMSAEERKAIGFHMREGHPSNLSLSYMVLFFREMGVLLPAGKGKTAYKVTIFGDWRVVIDRGKFIRVIHIHEDGEAYQTKKFFVGRSAAVGPQASQGRWECLKCNEPEPIQVKGFVMLNTIGD